MQGHLAAPRTELLELDFTLNLFLILMGIIIAPFANGTAQGHQIICIFDLCHMSHNTPNAPKMQLPRELLKPSVV